METASSEVHRSACPLDCPDTCSLAVTVEAGRVTKVEGTRLNPLTAGFICSKVRRFDRHLYGPERILRPAVRQGPPGSGEFRDVSWEEALDLVAERLQQAAERDGGESILPFSYGGSNGSLSQDTTDARLFYRLGASRLARTVCAAATGRAAEGLYGKMPGVAFADYVEAQLIVLWGVNPSASGIHLVPIVQEAQRRGAKLVVVDPRRTPLAKKADLHLALRPGTDLPVALAVIRTLFAEGRADLAFLREHTTGWEELRRRAEPWTPERAAEVAGIRAAEVERFVDLYAGSKPAVLRCGWGLERNRNGGSAVASVLAIPAVGGKFGVRGGGYTLSNSGAWSLRNAAGEPEPTTRVVNMNRLGSTLLEAEPPVRLLFVYNANPLATIPDQERVRAGLLREDLFVVTFEQVMTDTARYSDVVLPATTFLERRELRKGYGVTVLQDAPPVIPPVGESRSNHEVFADLLHRLGLARPGEAETAEELLAALVDDEVRRRLDRDGIVLAFEEDPVQMVDIRPRTADGKIHMVPEALDREAPGGLYAYREDPATGRHPLALISPASSRTVSSSFGQLYRDTVALRIHPDDAAPRRIRTGDEVRVTNDLGEVRCPARVSRDLRPGVVELPKGLWSHHTLNGATSNALCPEALTDLGGGATFNDARVEVAKV